VTRSSITSISSASPPTPEQSCSCVATRARSFPAATSAAHASSTSPRIRTCRTSCWPPTLWSRTIRR
jgi:hypothetical protein